MYAIETRDIAHNGITYRAQFFHDSYYGEPWKECDCFGIVSDWERRDKAPGEVIINEHRGSKRFYDIAATMEKAKRDGWGLSPEDKEALARKLGRAPTKGDITAEAVRQDMLRMRAWCNDEWGYIGIEVFPLTVDGDELKSKARSLWGIESDSGSDYFEEVIQDLINEIEG